MTWIPVWTFLYVEKLRTAPACIRPDDSAARLDDPQCSIKPQDFFPKHRYGKIAATIRMMWIPVRTRSSIRQVSQFKSRRPDASQHGPNARASDMENCVHQISCPNDHPPGPDPRSLYMEITYSERATVWTTGHHRPDAALKPERSSVKFLEFRSHSCPSGRPMTTVRTTPSFIKPDAYLNCQPINRGP
jgi:hypothetical protein